MASASSSSSSGPSSSTSLDQSRHQAGPLPTKRGEIGFNEDLHAAEEGRSSPSNDVQLPARHPADRDAEPAATADDASTDASTDQSRTDDTSSTNSTNSMAKRSIFKFLKPRKMPSIGGFMLATLLLFGLQLGCIVATIAGWVLTVQRSNRATDDSSNPNTVSLGTSSAIFLHVVFGVAVLAQFVFLERRIFRLRAERYSYKHPGEILPSARHRELGDISLAFAPWNRPPLPTYAAALQQSGVGTGDVEDHIIAQPPPPAYGNTRGSTLILSGFLTNMQRVQRPASVHSRASSTRDRPLSYASHDSEWEVIQDADRAMQLEATLSRLERAETRDSRR